MKFLDFNEVQGKYLNLSCNENFGRYLNKILNKKYRLSQTECIPLIKDVQEKNDKSDKSLEKLIISFQSLCFMLAKKYCNNYYFFDFMSEANFGLIKAIETYDTENQTINFLSYAIKCILTYTMRNSDGSVISLNGKPLNYQIKRFIDKFYVENGYYPSEQMIEDEFPDVKRYDIQRIEHSNSTFVSLDGFNEVDDSLCMRDKIEYQINENEDMIDECIDYSMDRNVYLEEINQYYEQEINRFNGKTSGLKNGVIPTCYKEKYIIEHLYGLNGNKILSAEELATIFNCSTQMIYRIKLTAIQKLQKYFKQKDVI